MTRQGIEPATSRTRVRNDTSKPSPLGKTFTPLYKGVHVSKMVYTSLQVCTVYTSLQGCTPSHKGVHDSTRVCKSLQECTRPYSTTRFLTTNAKGKKYN